LVSFCIAEAQILDNFSAVDKSARYTQNAQRICRDLSTGGLQTPENHGMDPKKTFLIEIQPAGLQFEQVAGMSLLQSGLRAGVRLPNSCRNGTCRTCMCKLSTGEIEYQIEWPGLAREEKAEGWILPCVAEARSDLVLDVPGAVDLKAD
jgi:ferredoxin